MIEFRKEITYSRVLDPKDNREVVLTIETRYDPLTGETGTVYDSPLTPFRKIKLPKTDLTPWLQKSKEMGCPFCPGVVEKMTPLYPPQFLPEGRLRVGPVLIFPNPSALAPYCALAVLGEEHFLDLPDFTEDLLAQGITACQVFLRRLRGYDGKLQFCSLNWNYMPPAGASMLHPHLQLMASYTPTNRQRAEERGSSSFYRKYRVPFWSQLVEEEEKRGERFLGWTGRVAWLGSFIPKGMLLDAQAVFPDGVPLPDLDEREVRAFAQGLLRVFRYLAERNIVGFNLSIYSGMAPRVYRWAHARIISRAAWPPMNNSDLNFPAVLHDEPTTASAPEEVARELKAYF